MAGLGLALVWAAGVIVLALPAGAASSATTTGQASVGAADAWYNVTPACGLGGCGVSSAPPVNPYPTGTLHIGIEAGQEDARTYLRPDLSSLPAGAVLTGGTLVAAVGGSADGSQSVGSAAIVACLVTQPFTAASGGFGAAPTDCSTSAPAKLSSGSSPSLLSVDLAPFAKRWAAGAPYDGIALVPADSARADQASWQVALQGDGDTEAGARPVSAQVTYSLPAPATSGGPSAASAPKSAPASSGTTSQGSGTVPSGSGGAASGPGSSGATGGSPAAPAGGFSAGPSGGGGLSGGSALAFPAPPLPTNTVPLSPSAAFPSSPAAAPSASSAGDGGAGPQGPVPAGPALGSVSTGTSSRASTGDQGPVSSAGNGRSVRASAASAVLTGAGGAYQEIWVVPLALVVVGGFLGFALTREVRVEEA